MFFLCVFFASDLDVRTSNPKGLQSINVEEVCDVVNCFMEICNDRIRFVASDFFDDSDFAWIVLQSSSKIGSLVRVR